MSKTAALPTLPAGILDSDLAHPKDWKLLAHESYDSPKYTQYGGTIQFDLWYTERFGWAIPTLGIRNASARHRSIGITAPRTYAVTVKDKSLITCGLGPHVKARVTVYVKKSRFKALQPYLDIMIDGQVKANDCRDRISTRRANTLLRRSFGLGGIF